MHASPVFYEHCQRLRPLDVHFQQRRLSAGRKNADYALFPYYTDDKITESAEITGSKSIFLVHQESAQHIWEPFSNRYEGIHRISRNLYKHIFGNKIIFEEINHDLHLTFQVEWNSSDKFGFVRKSRLINHAPAGVSISLLDGIQIYCLTACPAVCKTAPATWWTLIKEANWTRRRVWASMP
jgi:hypothetical protein